MLLENLNGSTWTFAYNAADEMTLAAIGGTDYSSGYDGAGQWNSFNGAPLLTYNTAEQTTALANPGQSYSFFGNGQTEQTGYNGSTFTSSQLGISGITTGSNPVFITRDNTGEGLSELTSSGYYYDILDPRGTVLDVTNNSGQIVTTNTYDPYGNTTTGGGGPNDLTYLGTVAAQGAAGNYHFGARIYSAPWGHWTQPDPAALNNITDPTQANPYTYAGDNPISNADTGGLDYYWGMTPADARFWGAGLREGGALTGAVPLPGPVAALIQFFAAGAIKDLGHEVETCGKYAKHHCRVIFNTFTVPILGNDTCIPTFNYRVVWDPIRRQSGCFTSDGTR